MNHIGARVPDFFIHSEKDETTIITCNQKIQKTQLCYAHIEIKEIHIILGRGLT